MDDKEKKELNALEDAILNALEDAILSALNSGRYILGLGNDDQRVEWVSGDKPAELWLVDGPAESYVSNLAHDLLALFGDRALALLAPVVIINNTTNFNNATNSIASDFEIMKLMQGGAL